MNKSNPSYVYKGFSVIREVASSSDAGCNTSLIAGNSPTVHKKEAAVETIRSNSPSYPFIKWTAGDVQIIDETGVSVPLLHSGKCVGTMKLDLDDLPKVKFPVEINPYGYAVNRDGHVSRIVCGLPKGLKDNHRVVVDHISDDKLDNRKSNLRVVSQKENTANRHVPGRKNKTLPNGIIKMKLRQKYTSGGEEKVSESMVYQAKVTDLNSRHDAHGRGRHLQQMFSISKYGEKTALELALKALTRLRKIAGYPENTWSCSTTIPGAGVGSSDPK